MWQYIPQAVCNYAAAHPYLAAAQVSLAVPTLVPGFIATPVLGYLGFNAIGVSAGSAAAAYQSAHGATWVFSGLQSAAMGGYGVPAVNGMVAGVGGAGIAVAEWLKWM